MTMERTTHQPRQDALTRLVDAGRGALPPIDPTTTEQHLSAMREARLLGPARQPARSALPRRRAALVLVGAGLLAVPSMALADVLPDPMQRAVSRAAAVVGLDLPTPDLPVVPVVPEADPGVPTPDGSTRVGDGSGNAPEPRGEGLGRPAPGEQRGNRFGQVSDGPDKGRAQPARGEGRPAVAGAGANRPASQPRPERPAAKPPRPAAPASPRPAAPARPAATPEPAARAPVAPTPGEPTRPAPARPAGGGERGGAPDGAGRAGQG